MPDAFHAHLLTLTRYHHWAYERLFEELAAVDDDAYRRDEGLFFGSIHGTLNHLLLAERVWMGRLVGRPFTIRTLADELIRDRAELEATIREESGGWTPLVEALTPEELHEAFDYHNTRGDAKRAPRGPILAHVVNHGTHHRGQISAAMTRLGARAPVMDLLYYLVPGA